MMVVVDLIYRDLAELNAHVLMCSRVHTHGVDLSEAYVRTHMHKCTARPATETVCALHGRASGALSLYHRCMLVCLNVRTYWHDLHCQCATTLRIAPWPPQSSLIPRADRIGQRNDRRSVYHNNLTSRSDQIRPSGRVVVFRVRVVGQPGINGTDPTTHESMMLSRLL